MTDKDENTGQKLPKYVSPDLPDAASMDAGHPSRQRLGIPKSGNPGSAALAVTGAAPPANFLHLNSARSSCGHP